jgi:hypothetical protein
MQSCAQIEFFPGFENVSRKERSKWAIIGEMSQISQEHGQLIPQDLAWKILDISKQRMSQLVNEPGEARIRSWQFFGKTWVCENDLRAYAVSEREAGRPLKEKPLKELWRASQEFVLGK